VATANRSQFGKLRDWVWTNRRPIGNVGKYVLATGLLGYVIWSNWAPASGNGLERVWHEKVLTGQIQWHFFVLALVTSLASVLMTLVRWYFLVRAQDLPFTLPNAIRLGLVGFFFNTFLPGSVGGDIVKAAFIAREQQSRRTTAVATVIMDRVIALWGLVCFVAMLGSAFWLTGTLENQASKDIVLSALGIVGASVIGWLVLGFLPERRAERFAARLSVLPKVGHAAAEFWRAVWMYRCRKKTIALALVLSWIGHVGFVLTFYFCVLTLWDASQKIPTFSEHFLLVPIGLVIQAAPLFPGGAGIGELGFGGLYALLGCPAALGVLGSLVYRVVNWILGGLGYVVFLRMRPTLKTDEPNPPPSVPVRETVGAGVA
jgi:glycosyltransferase 2 family protein